MDILSILWIRTIIQDKGCTVQCTIVNKKYFFKNFLLQFYTWLRQKKIEGRLYDDMITSPALQILLKMTVKQYPPSQILFSSVVDNQDPDSNPETQDPDPHPQQFADEKPKCMENEPI